MIVKMIFFALATFHGSHGYIKSYWQSPLAFSTLDACYQAQRAELGRFISAIPPIYKLESVDGYSVQHQYTSITCVIQ